MKVEKVKSVGLNLDQYTWKYFCETTSIHGLLHLFVKTMGKPARLMWTLTWLTMAALSASEIQGSVKRYLKYNVATTTQPEIVSHLAFPSITFCNTNSLLRSVAGTSPDIISTLRLFVYRNISALIDGDFDSGKSKLNDYCVSNQTSELIGAHFDELLKIGMNRVLSIASPSSRTSAVKCWWNGVEIPCRNLFVDHATDLGWCFTFNPSRILRNIYQKNSSTSNDDYSEMTVSQTGKRSGLRLLFNTDQANYCSTVRKYVGAGFKMLMHDTSLIEPSFETFPVNAYSLLTPGFETSLSLKAVKFQRFTDQLGKCLKPMYVQNDAKIYNKDICMLICFSLDVYKTCGCFPGWVEGREQFVVDNCNIPRKNVTLCQSPFNGELYCFYQKFTADIEKINAKCSYCNVAPCFETKYEYQKMSNSYLSPAFDQMQEYESNVSARKNLILLNVFYENLSTLKVIEKQEFSELDMTIYIGSILGLFLGMSFTTFFEILFQFYVYFAIAFTKLFACFMKKPGAKLVKSLKRSFRKYTKRGSVTTEYLMQQYPKVYNVDHHGHRMF